MYAVVLIALVVMVALLIYSMLRKRERSYGNLNDEWRHVVEGSSFADLDPDRHDLKESTRPASSQTKDGQAGIGFSGAGRERPCPLCKKMLRRGERVHSVVYSGSASPAGSPPRPAEIHDALTHMFGCPYCRPGSAAGRSRICPVCHATLAADGFVVARMFEGRERKHIHVLGCTECRPSMRSVRKPGPKHGESAEAKQ